MQPASKSPTLASASASDVRPPRKHIGQHIYDWVNTCELTQLDAIMLAVFVLTVGCGTIGGLFVMGFLQNAMIASKGPPMVVQTIISDRGPVQYRGFVIGPQAPTFFAPPPAFVPAGVSPLPTMMQAGSLRSSTVADSPCSSTIADFGRPRSDAEQAALWHMSPKYSAGGAQAATATSAF